MGAFLLVAIGAALSVSIQESIEQAGRGTSATEVAKEGEKGTREQLALLETLEVKGRAAKTGYARAEFGNGWARVNGCSTRDIILYRDLTDAMLEGECKVVKGVLADPYTGKMILFSKEQSTAVQIDHIVPLSDAWQKGAQLLTKEQRIQLANDPLELIAVDGPANQQKGDGDAATWLPKNKAFRCTYIARQIAVKAKYHLWVTPAEKKAMKRVLEGC